MVYGNGSNSYGLALSTLVHELVHVKQYRVLGTDTFLLNYSIKNAPFVSSGYGRGPYEREAYNFSADIFEVHGGHLCQSAAAKHKRQNERFELGRDPVNCKVPAAWTIPIIAL